MAEAIAIRPGRIEPPWFAAQVNDLNLYQRSGRFHPFTCRDHGDAHHAEVARAEGEATPGLLVAGPDGWTCPACDYRQRWAHAFMAEPIPAPAVTPEDRLVRTESTIGTVELHDLLGIEDDGTLDAVIPTCIGEWRREGPDTWRAWTYADRADEEEA